MTAAYEPSRVTSRTERLQGRQGGKTLLPICDRGLVGCEREPQRRELLAELGLDDRLPAVVGRAEDPVGPPVGRDAKLFDRLLRLDRRQRARDVLAEHVDQIGDRGRPVLRPCFQQFVERVGGDAAFQELLRACEVICAFRHGAR
jgi:hypothetical protein